MQIRDYDLINDINPLFEKEIIIYGAGKYGKKIAQLLEDAEVSGGRYYFCDSNESIKEHLVCSVITLHELEEKVKQEDCMIVVCSKDSCNEMIEELDRRKIDAYVCTWYGVKAGIEININDIRFSEFFRRDLLLRKELYRALQNDINVLSVATCRKMLGGLPEFLIYQPGKVGSSTVYETLLKEGFNAEHVHWIAQNTHTEEMKRVVKYFTEAYRKYNKPAKIITLVREPIVRQLSFFMELFQQDLILLPLYEDSNLAENCSRRMVAGLDTNREFTWFDDEIKELTGVDIYQHPFDKKKGYAWIKEGNIEILVLKLEKLNDNIKVLGEFVGKPDLELFNSNVSNEKHSKYIYRELKERIKLPARILDEQYRYNPKLDHFYTEEEKTQFRQKWSKYIVDDTVE